MLWYYGVILMPLFVGIVLVLVLVLVADVLVLVLVSEVLVLVLVLEPTVLETSLHFRVFFIQLTAAVDQHASEPSRLQCSLTFNLSYPHQT